jgi:hypothetical protein
MVSSESFADDSTASEAGSPAPRRRSHRNSREDPSEELRERMASIHLMSGGLGDRDDDFVRPSRREARNSCDDYDEYEDEGYRRRGRRGGYGEEEAPREERSYRRRMASMFGGGGGGYGRR